MPKGRSQMLSWTKLRHYFGNYRAGCDKKQVVSGLLAVLSAAVEARRLWQLHGDGSAFRASSLVFEGCPTLNGLLLSRTQGGKSLADFIDEMHWPLGTLMGPHFGHLWRFK